MIPTIKKPTRIATNTATAIDHVITNVIIDTDFKTRILKICILDHFVIMLAFQIQKIFNETSFRFRLWEVKCDNLKTSNDSNLAYNEFLVTFTFLYDDCFPSVKIKVKARNSFRPWITKDITKSSKKKQKLYEKRLKNRNPQNLATCETYKKLFEAIKRKSKKTTIQERS